MSSTYDDLSIPDKIVVLVLVSILLFLVWATYQQVVYWGPQQQAEDAKNARIAAIAAEARRVEVKNKAEVKAEATMKRFSAEFYGEFNGGFGNNIRQIFVLTDSETGCKYLEVTGCGVSELYTETYTVKENKKNVTKTRTVEE